MGNEVRKTKVSPISPKSHYELLKLWRAASLFDQLFCRKPYREARMKVFRANARDYRRSCRLEGVLTPLTSAELAYFPDPSMIIDDDWRAFRVERFVTGSIRGEIAGRTFVGTTTQSLFDSSSVIFLKNVRGETMRTLVPSHATASEVLVQAIERWRENAGYEYNQFADYWIRSQDTHTSRVIRNFVRPGQWTSVLTHPEIIDMIDASCQQPEEERPIIRLAGELIQKGVALATSIEVKGERHIFFPAGFFNTLAGAIRAFVPEANEPRIIEA